MSFAGKLVAVRERIAAACQRASRSPDEVRVIAVTKTATEQQIIEAINSGQLDLGENRAQVLESHAIAVGHLPNVRWHMIGHLQRNKVRDVLPIVHSIQSVDSLRLAQEIEKEAAKAQRSMPVLLEINSGEEQKFGAPLETAIELAAQIAQMPHVQLQGLMSMAPLTEDDGVVRATFARTRELFEQIRSRGFAGEGFKELSMGMSGDFEIAVEQGATMVRLGSVLFGNS